MFVAYANNKLLQTFFGGLCYIISHDSMGHKTDV